MDKLNDTQKQCLRTLVKAVRDKTIPEEFRVFWKAKHALVGPMLDRASREYLQVPGFTQLTAEILTTEGFLFSQGAATYTHSERTSGRETSRNCIVTPPGFQAVDSNFAPILDLNIHRAPVEITDSLVHFRRDYPDSTRLAFIMMRFARTSAHTRIHGAIQSALGAHGMLALRSDDKQYHDDLYYNVLTYIYGVRFGIAVFERIEADDFNPNVSLETGYMLALGKAVCLLKDQTLRTLHTDLAGKLYRPFDPQDPNESIPPQLFKWMYEKGFIVSHTAINK